METSLVVDNLRSAFRSGVPLPEQFRRTQLMKLMSMIKDNEEQILKALHQDLAKVQYCSRSPAAQQRTRVKAFSSLAQRNV